MMQLFIFLSYYARFDAITWLSIDFKWTYDYVYFMNINYALSLGTYDLWIMEAMHVLWEAWFMNNGCFEISVNDFVKGFLTYEWNHVLDA